MAVLIPVPGTRIRREYDRPDGRVVVELAPPTVADLAALHAGGWGVRSQLEEQFRAALEAGDLDTGDQDPAQLARLLALRTVRDLRRQVGEEEIAGLEAVFRRCVRFVEGVEFAGEAPEDPGDQAALVARYCTDEGLVEAVCADLARYGSLDPGDRGN